MTADRPIGTVWRSPLEPAQPTGGFVQTGLRVGNTPQQARREPFREPAGGARTGHPVPGGPTCLGDVGPPTCMNLTFTWAPAVFPT